MSSFLKVGTTAAVLAVLGAFFLGRVVAEQSTLPDVGDPITVGSTASPAPTDDTTTRPPRDDRSPGDRRTGRPGASATEDDDDGDGSHGRNRGRGRGGDDDIDEIGPTPSEFEDQFDDHGGDDNSGPGSDDSGSGSDDD